MSPAKEPPQVTLPMLESLYRLQYARFLRVAYGSVGDRDLAHDAVQETFARAIKARIEFRSQEAVVSWLWRTLMNICIDEQRARRHLSPNSPPEVAASSNGRAPAGDWSDLRAVIAALPERQRQAIFLRHYADLDYDTIAEALEIERGTVAATLHTAHATLRRALEEVRT